VRTHLFFASLLLISAACRSEDMMSVDLAGIDMSVADLPDIAGIDLPQFDLPGVDLTPPPDLLNADLYMPLFAPPVSYAAESGPIYLAAADLNKDTFRDMIVVNTNDPTGFSGPATPSSVNVLLGVGNGTFQAKMSANIDDFPYGIAIADLNADTNVDLVIALYDGYDVLLGQGNGMFGAPTKVTVGTTVRFVSLGDIDGDNLLDVVLAARGAVAGTGSVWVARGAGNGTFAAATSFEVSTVSVGDVRRANVVRLADMNADGKLDVVTSNTTATTTVNSISILANTSVSGTVALATPVELTAAARPRDMVLAQLDNSNKLDIILANAGNDTVSIYLSDTPGAPLTYAAPVNYTVGAGPYALAFADIDSDTKVDVVTANSLGASVTVLYGGIGGVFGVATASRPGSETYAVGNNPIAIVAGTLNADVKVDVVTANQNTANISVLINQR